jgi:two-component system nitrate/nitrite response regulator NarL
MNRDRDHASAVRTIIVADVKLYVVSLAAIVPRDRVQVVGTAQTRSEATALVHALQPDVVVVDITMPESFDLMRQLRADPPPVNVIAFGVNDDLRTIIACAEAGAGGYLDAQAGVEDLVVAIEGAALGEARCPPRVTGELFRRAAAAWRSAAPAAQPNDEPTLTGRQQQVLAMLRQSLSNKEIGVALNISESTVKNHVHQLLGKLQVPNRAKAAKCLVQPRSGRSLAG